MFGVKDVLYKLGRSLTATEDSLSSTEDSSQNFSKKPNNLKQIKTESNLNFKGNTWNDTDGRDNEMDMLPQVKLIGYLPATKNRLLTVEMCDEIRMLMPTRIQLYNEWTLLYSLEQHGASLHSLYNNVTPSDEDVNRRIGYVIVIKDRHNGIFGAYSNEPLLPHEHKRYYGNGECFLWKLEKVPDVRIGNNKETKENEKDEINQNEDKWQFVGYPYTGVNEFAIYCTSEFLSMGAGDGRYGLWCDGSLLRGVSYPCQTYGNEPLSKEGEKFHIMGLEVWRVG
ncbi:oxidation resistance protein 1 [Maudiozyma exigua]|uniref:Oxidation resistance protein 1 n=1 Tax=Maudiozyma exigua TaxID=34358 RepID=A0A9P6WBY0_MAUEX|nr:oxidation resistance protein 1 [Kazachstania exigua]